MTESLQEASTPQNKAPLRDFLGQEIKVGDVLCYARTERGSDHFPVQTVVRVKWMKELLALAELDLVILATSQTCSKTKQPEGNVGDEFRIVAMLEVVGKEKYYHASQFFMKIQPPEGL